MEESILPKKELNPDHKRLDGRDTGGNWDIAGIFAHNNKLWKVHLDTHHEPLLIAYRAVQQNESAVLFRETSTNTSKGNKLILVDNLQRKLTNPKWQHLYIYEHLQG